MGRKMMKRRFSIGDRVKLSSLGTTRCPRLAGKVGTVVGRSIYVNSVAILLDGTKSRKTVHNAYLEVISENIEDAAKIAQVANC
jgi:ribosomal protein L21E